MSGLIAWLALCSTSFAWDNQFKLELSAQSFPTDPPLPAAYDFRYGVAGEAEFENSYQDGNVIFTFTPFGRWDSEDNNRDHVDIRELNLLYYQGSWEVLAGLSRVFWGVAESSHLVDIINQTDYLEGFDGEDKLGQPMLRLSHSFEQSTLTGFILPGFREREFLSPDDPLALPFEVTNDPLYESDRGDDHVDFALRYSGYRGILDYGISVFEGTARSPQYISNASGELVPYYPITTQFGLDFQITDDAWLWKFEGIRGEYDDSRLAAGDSYYAAVGGFEYTFFGVKDNLMDLGVLLEYHYDSRGDPRTIAFQNDVFSGIRFGFNDAESSEVLAGVFVDFDDQTTTFRVEGNRRVLTNSRLIIEAQMFTNVDDTNVTSGWVDSDFILLSLEINF